MVAGDFNGDGVTDLAVTTNQRRSITLLLGTRSVPFVLQQAPGFTLPEQSSVISRLAVGDFDHNGSPDLALTYRVSQPGGGYIEYFVVYLGAPHRPSSFYSLGPVQTGASPQGNVGEIMRGDWNHDGRLDAALIESPGDLVLLHGRGHGLFPLKHVVVPAFAASSRYIVAAGDFNRDGKDDLVVADENNSYYLLLGNGTGGFTDGGAYVVPGELEAVDSIQVGCATCPGFAVVTVRPSGFDPSFYYGDMHIFASAAEPPSAALATRLGIHRSGPTVFLTWRVSNPSSLLGFNVYVNHSRLNQRLITTHQSSNAPAPCP